MVAAIDIADRIASAAECLHQHGHHDVAAALELVIVGADDLPSALGAASGWRAAARLKARDAALRALVRHLAPDGTVSVLSLAERMASVVGRYHDAAWKADRRAGRRPDDPTLGLVFDLLCTSKPLAVRTMRLLIAGIVGNRSDGARQRDRAA